jgi:ABC-type transport system involved in multi-copper enzyme maturation permease subunit
VSSVALSYESGPALLRRQLLAVMRLELAKGLSIGRSLWLFLLAFAPAFIITMHALKDRGCSLAEETMILAAMVQFFYLRFAIFFGCLGLSMRLLRGEVAEKTLHYGLLAPLRRERLIVGKFLASALLAALIFGAGVLTCFALMFGHFEASLGYSSVFLALSLLFKNPVVPGMIVLLWELASAILPVWLKRFTVTYYLKPLYPVALPLDAGFSGLFTVVAEPMAPWLAVTGLLAFAGAVVAFACWRIRRFEISYSSE